jgi:hypothetical protein
MVTEATSLSGSGRKPGEAILRQELPFLQAAVLDLLGGTEGDAAFQLSDQVVEPAMLRDELLDH